MNTIMKVGTSLAFFIHSGVLAQQFNPNVKSFEKDGEFRYRKSKTEFPERSDGLKRSTITDYGSVPGYGSGGISVAYVPTEGSTGKITVYIYPDNATSDFDARIDFHNLTEAIMSTSGSPGDATKYIVSLDCKSFKVPGLAAEITKPDSSEWNYLSLHQCGKWALKVRITTAPKNREKMLSYLSELLRAVRPEEIVNQFPFNPDSNRALIDKGSLRDSVFAAAVLIGSYAELVWTENHVSTAERRAGFPGLYLGGHFAALKIMLSAWQGKDKYRGDSRTIEIMETLHRIDSSGYLKEFVMDGYQGLLKPLPTDTLRMDAYRSWRQNNPISLDPRKRYFTIVYEK